ncbi:MAG: hypothetical protein PVH21_10305 [Myxococcales bacterium]|jgi:hypothetical protein
MARSVLFVLGIGAIGWGVLCFFAGPSLMPQWMGLGGPAQGDPYIEALAYNVGLWSALGIFAILGALFQRLRLAAALAFLVCAAGMAGGRILAMVQGASSSAYMNLVLAMEVAIVVAALAAYVSEKRRLSRQAKEQKRAEKAALEAALAAGHEQRTEQAPSAAPLEARKEPQA